MGSLRKLLYPLAVLFGLVLRIRHALYNKGLFKSVTYDFPIICVGNLSVGGTGKSPMTEYLIRLLSSTYKTGVLSRGYKRKTSGYVIAGQGTDAAAIGDEPYQYFRKFKNINVAVSEERTIGIQKLIHETETEVILLDDAFQHRKVKAGLNLLLSAYDNLFTEDYLLPTGNLRDLMSRAKAADIIIITKCPDNLATPAQEKISGKLKSFGNKPVYFTTIVYNEYVQNNAQQIKLETFKETPFTLVTGIAKPMPLVHYLKNRGCDFEHISFSDHHNFSITELEQLKSKKLILTTEKDFSRLEKHLTDCYYISIEPRFLGNTKSDFNRLVLDYISKEKRIR